MDTNSGDGRIETKAFTVGINTAALVTIVAWIYKFATTGDPSPLPGMLPV